MNKKKILIVICMGILAYIIGIGFTSYLRVKMDKVDPETSSMIVTTKYLQASTVESYASFLNKCKKYMTDEQYSELLSYPSWISEDERVYDNKVNKVGYWSGKNYIFDTAEDVHKYFDLTDAKYIVDNQVIYDEKYKKSNSIGRYHIYCMDVTVADTSTFRYYVTVLTDTHGKVKSIYIKSSEKV